MAYLEGRFFWVLMGALFGIISLALQISFNPFISVILEKCFIPILMWNLHSRTKLMAMLSAAGKFKKSLHHVTNCENS